MGANVEEGSRHSPVSAIVVASFYSLDAVRAWHDTRG